jgi:glutamate N-acetyltransferase/amino-acid N-acetyltransferase
MVEQPTLPQGFRAAGLHCGIKADPQVFDLAAFVSASRCTAAGVFTRNRVCGAPVQVSRQRVPSDQARGVIINSGNANACTGERGLEDARWMTSLVAEQLSCPAESVLVCSTGVIGRHLPRPLLADGIPAVIGKLAASPGAFKDAARGMMTTDTVPKQASRKTVLNGKPVVVSGCAKGAAMIGPNMATMLAVVMTDTQLAPADADLMLRQAVDFSFNCISVEGHTSTSDTVLLLANGAAGTGVLDEEGHAELQRLVDEVCEALATAIIRDAEGAEHFVTIDVKGVRTSNEARQIARTVADSALVKTAIAGADPNWGRIVSAVGYSGVDVAETDITLVLNGMLLYKSGAPVDFDARTVSNSLRNSRDVSVELTFPLGDASVRFWTSDLTAEYVRLNADYTT